MQAHCLMTVNARAHVVAAGVPACTSRITTRLHNTESVRHSSFPQLISCVLGIVPTGVLSRVEAQEGKVQGSQHLTSWVSPSWVSRLFGGWFVREPANGCIWSCFGTDTTQITVVLRCHKRRGHTWVMF